MSDYDTGIMVGRQQAVRDHYAKRRRRRAAIAAVALALAGIAAGWGAAKTTAATASCQLEPAKAWAGTEPGEVYTGRSRTSCTVSYRVLQQIEYKDRWHVLGQAWHGPYPAGAELLERDEHTYAPACGWWRVRDVAYDRAGHQIGAKTGTATWFCS